MQTLMESNKVRSELDAKLAEIKQLQMTLNGREQQAVGTSIENLKEVNKALEKENYELKVYCLTNFYFRRKEFFIFGFPLASDSELIYIFFCCLVETK